MLHAHRDTVTRAARAPDPGIVERDLETGQNPRGQKNACTEKPREEIEAEKEGVRVPLAVRWLGRPSEVKARFKGGAIVASSVTFAVKGEDVFGRLLKSGLRLLGRRILIVPARCNMHYSGNRPLLR